LAGVCWIPMRVCGMDIQVLCCWVNESKKIGWMNLDRNKMILTLNKTVGMLSLACTVFCRLLPIVLSLEPSICINFRLGEDVGFICFSIVKSSSPVLSDMVNNDQHNNECDRKDTQRGLSITRGHRWRWEEEYEYGWVRKRKNVKFMMIVCCSIYVQTKWCIIVFSIFHKQKFTYDLLLKYILQ